MSDIKILMDKAIAFRDDRDWKQFHDPKEVAIALSIEAAEVLELFRYKSNEASLQFAKDNIEEVSDELADVLFNVLIMAEYLDIDLHDALTKKLEKTAKKYPIEKAKGNATKYTEL